jgi:hypothetical protein
MITSLILSSNTRFYSFSNLIPEVNYVILATCFHPAFKLCWLPKTISDQEKKKIQNLCINEIECSV